MHGYDIDTDERRNTIFGLAILGLAAAFTFNRLLDVTDVEVPWWFDAPASFGFFGLFYWAFDQWVWRLRILRTLRIVSAPDLSGRWVGYVASSRDPNKRHDVAVTIEQS